MHKVVVTLLAVFMVVFIGFAVCYACLAFPWGHNNIFYDAFCRSHEGLRLGQTIKHWKEVLGEPEVLTNGNQRPFYYYWPDRGLAAFCSPLWHNQGRLVRNPENLLVNAIVLPCDETIKGLYLEEGRIARFKRISDVTIGGRRVCDMSHAELKPYFWFVSRTEESPHLVTQDYSNFPITPFGVTVAWVPLNEHRQIVITYVGFTDSY